MTPSKISARTARIVEVLIVTVSEGCIVYSDPDEESPEPPVCLIADFRHLELRLDGLLLGDLDIINSIAIYYLLSTIY